jgi:hypothetical protein
VKWPGPSADCLSSGRMLTVRRDPVGRPQSLEVARYRLCLDSMNPYLQYWVYYFS